MISGKTRKRRSGRWVCITSTCDIAPGQSGLPLPWAVCGPSAGSPSVGEPALGFSALASGVGSGSVNLSLLECLVDGFAGSILAVRQQVRAGTQREAGVRVPEVFGQGLHVLPPRPAGPTRNHPGHSTSIAAGQEVSSPRSRGSSRTKKPRQGSPGGVRPHRSVEITLRSRQLAGRRSDHRSEPRPRRPRAPRRA
jgi:hypothetical protein